MPRTRKSSACMCDANVRKAISHKHQRCNTTKPSKFLFPGTKINNFFGVDGLDGETEYKVCTNVADRLRNYKMPRTTKTQHSNFETPRRRKRHMTDLEKVTSVSLSIQGENRQSHYHMDQFGDTSTSDSKNQHRSSHRDMFCGLVKERGEGFRRPYEGIVMRERVRRVEGLAAMVIAACVDRDELEKKGVEYLSGNRELAVDVMTVLDIIKNRVQDELRVNLLSVNDEITPLPEGEDEEDNNPNYDSAIAMLGETSIKGYERMRKKIVGQNILCADVMPSYHMLTKNRPKINSFVIHPDLSSLDEANMSSLITIDDTTMEESTLVPLVHAPTQESSGDDILASFIGN